MTQHTDLIERLRASSEDGLTPDDAYAAAEALEAQAREIAELKAQEAELCTLYGLAQAECKKLRAEVEGLRKDAERYKFLRKCHWTDSPPTYVVTTLEGLKLNAMTYSDDRLDEVLDARVAANSTATQKGQP